MSEQTPPDKLVFRSDMKTASRQNTDYFAEQNKKRTEKKAKRKKYALLVGIPLCAVMVVLVVVTVVLLGGGATAPTTPEENQQTANTIYTQIMDDVSASRPILNGTGSSVAPTPEAIAEADTAFEAAIAEAVQNKNTGAADALRVAQMLFHINVGTDYVKMIEIGEKVSNVEKLEREQQLQYYSIMAAAYTNQGDEAKAAFYSGKAIELVGDGFNNQEEGGL